MPPKKLLEINHMQNYYERTKLLRVTWQPLGSAAYILVCLF